MNKKLTLAILYILFAFIVFRFYPKPHLTPSYAEEIKPIWEYECVDTMKTSRDNARRWANSPNLDAHIENQMNAIVELGGNCVAIATPYDDEFLPYLRKWVASARKHNLHIWYRGNFSSWEGWFEYPKGMTTEEHNQLTREFILQNPELFEDGDIFTPSPEAENGGPFNQVEIDEHEAFRKYLIEEYNTAKSAFEEIDKDVRVNWLAMNGGLAMRMFDQETVDALDKVVSIDHYIKTAPEMGEFIRYFNEKFGAKVVIGEWGAPIPQINGEMSESQQTAFIRDLLHEMYIHNDMVEGISYWVLYDGSTSLQNPDESPREAFYIVQDYYSPGAVTGYVRDSYGDIVVDALIEFDGNKSTQSDESGYYYATLPAGNHTIKISHEGINEVTEDISINSGEILNRDFVANSTDTKVEHWYHKLTRNIKNFFGAIF